MAEFTLSRREPQYVQRAKAIRAVEEERRAAAPGSPAPEAVRRELAAAGLEDQTDTTGLGSLVFALKPGDGSAREQAASCQRCWAAGPTSPAPTPPSATGATW
jgi:aconitate hydratase